MKNVFVKSVEENSFTVGKRVALKAGATHAA
jgi:hypothetical protein